MNHRDNLHHRIKHKVSYKAFKRKFPHKRNKPAANFLSVLFTCNEKYFAGIENPDFKMIDVNLLQLSNNITNPGMLRKLAVVGLGMESTIVDTHLNNNNNINDASHEVLKEWRNSQQNDNEAYRNISDIRMYAWNIS